MMHYAASVVISHARYVHTNIVAKDWRALARFYQDVFGCIPVLPERNLSGPELEAGTGVLGARIAGVHLRLPGFGDDGPTLEIFQYGESGADTLRAVNRPGVALLRGPEDTPWQTRELAFRDDQGHTIYVGQSKP